MEKLFWCIKLNHYNEYGLNDWAKQQNPNHVPETNGYILSQPIRRNGILTMWSYEKPIEFYEITEQEFRVITNPKAYNKYKIDGQSHIMRGKKKFDMYLDGKYIYSTDFDEPEFTYISHLVFEEVQTIQFIKEKEQDELKRLFTITIKNLTGEHWVLEDNGDVREVK